MMARRCNINIPNKLKVGGFTYKVIKNHKFPPDGDLMAQVTHSCLEIKLSNKPQTEKTLYCQERKEEAFIHEMIHCIDSVYNQNKLSETETSALSQGLYQVLKDNKL